MRKAEVRVHGIPAGVLKDFPYSADEQVREAIARAAKMSIQGVQPKLRVHEKIYPQF